MGARFNKPPAWPEPAAPEPVRDWILDPQWTMPPVPERRTGLGLLTRARGARQPARIPAARPTPPRAEATPYPFQSPSQARPAPAARSASGPFQTRPAGGGNSLTSAVFALGESTSRSGRPPRPPQPRPTPLRMIGWGALGVTLIAGAALTFGDLGQPTTVLETAPGPATAANQPPANTAAGNQAGNSAGTQAGEEASTSAGSVDTAIAQAGAGTALATLGELEVHPRGPARGYARDKFGSGLTDVDANGCDQRNDVLGRDLTEKTLKAGTEGCVVTSGTLRDPYTGQAIEYRRADGPGQLLLDHVVPLADAWLKGARDWSAAKRTRFNADPLNLLTVGPDATFGKQGADATGWLPSARDYHCAYVSRQVEIKAKYQLWVSRSERTKIGEILIRCPD